MTSGRAPSRRHRQPLDVDLDAVALGGEVRRGGRRQPVGLGQDALRRQRPTAAARSRRPSRRRGPPAPASSSSRRARAASAAANTVLPTSVSVPVTTKAGAHAAEPLQLLGERRRSSRSTCCLVDIERQREAQPRGALGHGRRADGADVEAARLHGGGERASRASSAPTMTGWICEPDGGDAAAVSSCRAGEGDERLQPARGARHRSGR